MIINSKDLGTLLSLLSEDDKTLEAISTTFYRTFNKIDHFKIGCAIYTMMKDGFIIDPTHRLVSFYILFSLYKPDVYSPISSSTSLSSSSLDKDDLPTSLENESSIISPSTSPPPLNISITTTVTTNSNTNSSTTNTTINNIPNTSSSPNNNFYKYSNIIDYPIVFNPFLPLFIDEIEKQINLELSILKSKPSKTIIITTTNASNYNNYNPIEKQYLIYFLTILPKDFIKKTSREILKTTTNNNNNNSFTKDEDQIDIQKLNDYKHLYLDRLTNHSFPSLKSIGISPNLFYPEIKHQSQQEQFNSIRKEKTLQLLSFEPQYNRISPPIYKPITTLWLNTNISHSLLLSPNMGLPMVTNSKKIVRDLMSKAIRGRLKKSQIQQIKTELDLDPKLVLYSGLVPKKLPLLVEFNTPVAIEALLKLIHSPDFKEYFQVLISMEMNYRSMEVVNALATSVELPKHFIPMYISNCMYTCNNIKDKARQQRSVRLVCVFIQSLIRNNIIDIKDLFSEVQSFCLSYSKISREAIGLYKLMNEEQPPSSSSQQVNITNETTNNTNNINLEGSSNENKNNGE